MIKLEVPVYTVEAAKGAAACGADRLELCADIGEGGTTPSIGLLDFLKSEIKIPIFAMIRPRGGDFCYTKDEIKVMERDIRLLGQAGADGFVFGALNSMGEVDMDLNRRLREAAGPKPCTFHRAIDVSADIFRSMEAITSLGFQRVLTSGGRDTVTEGLEIIAKMIEMSGDSVIVMPGGGTKPEHVERLAQLRHFKELHSSCKAWVPTPAVLRLHQVQLTSDPVRFHQLLGVDPKVLADYRNAITRVSN